MNYKDRLKGNCVTNFFITIIRKFQVQYLYMLNFALHRKLRRLNIDYKYYNKIKKYKDIHKGKRCFVIATGPSLTIDDLRKLKNEYTFGMNSLCLIFPKLGWETTYFGIQDVKVYNKLKKEIDKMNSNKVFLGDILLKHCNVKRDSIIYPLNLLNHRYKHKKYNTKFSGDSYDVVYDGYTITYSLIQIAVYMGFNEIYLIGADSNYLQNNGKRHFIEHGIVDPDFKLAGEKIMYSYNVARKHAGKNNIKIYNVTKGGMLEVFERKNLEDVINLSRML